MIHSFSDKEKEVRSRMSDSKSDELARDLKRVEVISIIKDSNVITMYYLN